MKSLLKKLWQDEEAPTAVEYAVMVAGIAIIVILAARYLGDQVSTTFKNVGDQVPGT